jgi:hypothetical protein
MMNCKWAPALSSTETVELSSFLSITLRKSASCLVDDTFILMELDGDSKHEICWTVPFTYFSSFIDELQMKN